ncbi:type IV secretory system conjugative DNA transfer family protein [Ruminococcaceae bacterium OttesenSCG-928-D13]|nr:type IV secretory system conjugative DNA transfer family protein [Ruminococcaceae bacterium OttesenSCG-928-D13]
MQNTPKGQGQQTPVLLWVLLAVPVGYLALVLADVWEQGVVLADFFEQLQTKLFAPWLVRWTDKSVAFLLGFLAVYGLAVFCFRSEQGNRRPGEEHGSAKWGNPKALNKKYANLKDSTDNIILTQNVSIGYDTHRHRRNLNILVVGSSGSGKTRFYCKPQLYNANGSCSYVVADPKGEMLAAAGPLLLARGYDLTVLDLVHMTGGYNPFCYMDNDRDTISLIHNLIMNTTPKESKTSDPFWDKAETALLMALILYLRHEAVPEEQNFPTVMAMLLSIEVREEDEDFQSPLDLLFEALEEQDPEHIAVKFYKVFKASAGKTAKSIIVSAAVRLSAMNIASVARMMSHDEMDFGSLGERKRAVFCILPDNDQSLNYIVGMLYTQCFQVLYRKADFEYGGQLPLHVHFIQDEWANVYSGDAPSILSTCRSRRISCSIIVQNISQIKEKYKDSWESIMGNTDEILVLGTSEVNSAEQFSKMLGKSSIIVKNTGITRGRSGSSSENLQSSGRELMTPDEIRLMDNRYALLFIRGEHPVMDLKYDIMKHPNIHLTADGGAEPYFISRHGESYARKALSFNFEDIESIKIVA